MLDNGYIRLYRSLLSWEWYDDINTKTVFLHLLLTVNFADSKWHGITIKRGQRICSISTLAAETKLSVKSVRVALEHLKKTQEVASERANDDKHQTCLYTVIRYDFFQEKIDQRANETASEGQANGKRTASERQANGNGINKNKEEKEEKEGEEEISTAAPAHQIKKEKFLNSVFLTAEEHKRLIDRFGQDDTETLIEYLDTYKTSRNVSYVCDYEKLIGWCADKLREQKSKRQTENADIHFDGGFTLEDFTERPE